MYWEVKTGKRPKFVEDLFNNRTYYLFDQDEEDLLVRLLIIGLALIERDDQVHDELSKISNWILV